MFSSLSLLNSFSFFLSRTPINLFFFFKKTLFLTTYYKINELIWQEGLLIDFLQKKICDNWMKKFLIFSANIFSEKFIFEKLVKIYLSWLIWPAQNFFFFDLNNVSNLLYFTIFFFILYLFSILIFFFALLMF